MPVKHFIIIILLFIAGGVAAQALISIPAHHINPATPKGTQIFTRITNTGTVPDTLYPLVSGPYPDLLLDSAHLINYFVSTCGGGESLTRQLSLINAVGRFLKSPAHADMLNIFSETNCDFPDKVIGKKYSLTGSELSIYQWQCGAFCREAIQILRATGSFSDNDFHIINLKNGLMAHTVMEVNAEGWIMVDVSPNTPGFMFADSTSPNGYASFKQVQQNPGYFTEAHRYKYLTPAGDAVDLCYGRSMAAYRKVFGQYEIKDIKKNITLQNLDGQIILCPGCSLEYNFTTGYMIDTTIEANKKALLDAQVKSAEVAEELGKGKDMMKPDAILMPYYKTAAKILNIDTAEARRAFYANQIQYYGSSSNWSPSYNAAVPVLKITVPASTDTIWIGRDLYCPMLVNELRSTHNGVTDTFKYNLWQPELLQKETRVMAQNIRYLNEPAPLPPGTKLEFSVAWNPYFLNFYKGGIMFRATSKKDAQVEISEDAFPGLKK